jgi:hypothetical protein
MGIRDIRIISSDEYIQRYIALFSNGHHLGLNISYRIQEFIPANGKRKVQEAIDDLSTFIRECFTPNAKYNADRLYIKNTSSCKFCPYTNKPDLCDKKV